MCKELEQLYEDGIKVGMEKGVEKGRMEGREEGTLLTKLSDIRNLVETLGLTAEAAMRALKVPEKERDSYICMLAEH